MVASLGSLQFPQVYVVLIKLLWWARKHIWTESTRFRNNNWLRCFLVQLCRLECVKSLNRYSMKCLGFWVETTGKNLIGNSCSAARQLSSFERHMWSSIFFSVCIIGGKNNWVHYIMYTVIIHQYCYGSLCPPCILNSNVYRPKDCRFKLSVCQICCSILLHKS